MQITIRSSVIGVSPRPEARSTERHDAGREVFGCIDHPRPGVP